MSLDREAPERIRPVPKEQIEDFKRAMEERIIPKIIAYQRRQAALVIEARKRIILP